jgi:hypothetical protein
VTDGHWHANAMAACVLVAFDLVRLIHTVQGPTSWKPCAHSILNSFLFFFHVIGGWGGGGKNQERGRVHIRRALTCDGSGF